MALAAGGGTGGTGWSVAVASGFALATGIADEFLASSHAQCSIWAVVGGWNAGGSSEVDR